MDEKPEKRDKWEKVSLVMKSSGGLLTAITVAIIGFIGSSYLKDRELEDNKHREKLQVEETNTRIYTELISKREESESALRKDMFVSIIQSFLKPGASGLDERVLNLELLAYNFHESLNLKPLFMYLEKQIISSGDRAKKDYLDRLYKVATEISGKQMLVLESAGRKTDRDIDLESLKQNPGGIALDVATLTLDGVARQFSIFVKEVDRQARQIKVRLEIKTPKDAKGNIETSNTEFWVGYFDFPMIDNTRLPGDQRVAIVLNAFEEGYAGITLAYFPGAYASLKEKPYYQEIIQNLKRTNAKLDEKP